jgi:hypothetical protein
MERSGAVPKKLTVCANADACDQGISSSCTLANPKLAQLLAEGPIIHTLSISCHASRCIHRLYQAITVVKKVKKPGARPPRPWNWISCLEIQLRRYYRDEINEEDFDDEDFDFAVDSDVDASNSFFTFLPPVTSFRLDLPRDSLQDAPLIPTLRPFLSRLTTLHIECDWYGDVIVRVLRCYHQGNLQELVLGCKGRYVEHLTTWIGDSDWLEDIIADTKKQFVLPKLHTLRFDDLHPDAFKITHFFQAPSLAELHVGFPSAVDEDIPMEDNFNLTTVDDETMSYEIPDFIRRSKCHATLKRLSVYGSLRLDLRDVDAWLDEKLLPSLTHLEFDGVYLPPEFFDYLRPYKASRGGPNLSRLKDIKILNLPTQLHSLGLYQLEVGSIAKSDGRHASWYLPDTKVTITLKNREA